MAATFFVNARERACFSYYTYSPRFENIGGSLQFRKAMKIVDNFKYFGLNKFTHGIVSDPVQKAMKLHQYSEVDSDKGAF